MFSVFIQHAKVSTKNRFYIRAALLQMHSAHFALGNCSVVRYGKYCHCVLVLYAELQPSRVPVDIISGIHCHIWWITLKIRANKASSLQIYFSLGRGAGATLTSRVAPATRGCKRISSSSVCCLAKFTNTCKEQIIVYNYCIMFTRDGKLKHKRWIGSTHCSNCKLNVWMWQILLHNPSNGILKATNLIFQLGTDFFILYTLQNMCHVIKTTYVLMAENDHKYYIAAKPNFDTDRTFYK